MRYNVWANNIYAHTDQSHESHQQLLITLNRNEMSSSNLSMAYTRNAHSSLDPSIYRIELFTKPLRVCMIASAACTVCLQAQSLLMTQTLTVHSNETRHIDN